MKLAMRDAQASTAINPTNDLDVPRADSNNIPRSKAVTEKAQSSRSLAKHERLR